MSKNTPRGVARFDRTPSVSVPRSKFDLSHSHKTTLFGGDLVPVLNMDLLPGDSIKCDLRQLCRMTTPIVPFMDRVRVSYFAFAVPKRLVWSHWEDYITGSHNGKLGTTHTTVPQATVKLRAHAAGDERYPGDIFDYMGIPPQTEPNPGPNRTVSVNALHLRAYNLIWNTWFRDQNLQDEIPLDIGDVDTANSYKLLKRCKRKDYFTSCLPWPQKGPDVSIGAGFLPVKTRSYSADDTATPDLSFWWTNCADGSVFNGGDHGSYLCLDGSSNATKVEFGVGQTQPIALKPRNLWADNTLTSNTVNSLRQAFAVQHLLERTARCGTRYVELLDGVFGVTSPDFRLQRPEYIGGGKVRFDVNSVPQTGGTATGVETPQGNLAAFARAEGEVNFQYSAVEHSILMVLACITTDLTYQSGIDRQWFRKTRTEEFFPEFAHLGEQPVYEKEIFVTGDDSSDNRVFGYQERFSEYRFSPSRLSGYMRSIATSPFAPQFASLDYWHLAQQFSAPPSLSDAFVTEAPPFERVSAVTDQPPFLLDIWFDMKAIRPLPIYSTPSMLDHF